MAEKRLSTVNQIAKLICEAVKEVLETSTQSSIRYAPTIQRVPLVSLKPDLGVFVEFTGDYSGLFCMNFSGEAAVELYRRAMRFMGLPEEDLAKDYTSDEVVNFVGELANQVIGAVRRKIETRFGLSAQNSQPRAIAINQSITLLLNAMLEKPQCRRLSFRTEDHKAFYVEFGLEQTEFIPMETPEEVNVDDILSKFG
ncbi:DUF3334 family protein [Thermosulfurimonas dismutans]|uniref:Chemotaxis protein CheX n=1 Tax=Thermosulfurimonas dismutans TaxID=999894 RepID=A0A179D7Z7_9BACT|nr:DUF3334 family protein [Thermosulfurimonas dismutans]OAQ21891.1 hypothetical protein TDIS_0409 [Thermosulfurimonas dismutans]